MIIVEGLDNTGKTTLAQKMAKNLQYELIASTGPDNLEDRMTSHLSMARRREHVIIDRTPAISEAVYGPVLRKRSRLAHHESRLMSLLTLQPVVIYCRPPTPRILCFNPDIPQMDGVIDRAQELLNAYDRLMESISYCLRKSNRFFTYDFTDLFAYDRLLEAVLHSETDFELPFGFVKQTLGALKV